MSDTYRSRLLRGGPAMLAAVSLALLASAAHAQPVDGTWEGPSQLQPFVFDIAGSGTSISNIRFTVVSCNKVPFTLAGPYPISGGSFDTGTTGGTCPSVHVTGSFPSGTTASGSTYIAYTYNAVTCPCTGVGGIPFSASPGIRGDADANGTINVNDVFYLINGLFAGGPAPGAKNGDADDTGAINVNDVFYLINFLFAGGPPPA